MIAEYVYVIAAPDAVKIGLAINPRARLKALQTGHYHHLSLQYSAECSEGRAYQVEQYAHQLLRERRLKGEWFAVDVDEARAAIEKAVNAVESAGGRQVPIPSKGGEKRPKVQKPWDEGWKFHPLADRDFEVIRFLMAHANDTGLLSDSQRVWSVPKTDLIKTLPELKDSDYEDKFWLRVFCFWFDYEYIALQNRPERPVCYPKARIFDEIDFYSDESIAEYAPSQFAALIVEEYGVDQFMTIIHGQSNGYKLKGTAA